MSPSTDDRLVLTMPDQRSILRDAVGSESGEVPHCLNHIGLPHPVETKEHIGSRMQLKLRLGIAPVVSQRQMGEPHCARGLLVDETDRHEQIPEIHGVVRLRSLLTGDHGRFRR